MTLEDKDMNDFLDRCYVLTEQVLEDKDVSKRYKALLATSFVGFVKYYGWEYIDTIWNAYMHSKFSSLSIKEETNSLENMLKQNREKMNIQNGISHAYHEAYYTVTSRGILHPKIKVEDEIILRKKYDSNIWITLICLIHEINHVVNAINNRILINRKGIFINKSSEFILRTGLKQSRINLTTLEEIEDRNILIAEGMNQLQTMEIMNEILSLASYQIYDPYIHSVLDSIKPYQSQIMKNFGGAYSGLTTLLNPLYTDEKFHCHYVKNNIEGHAKAIIKNFNYYTGGNHFDEFSSLVDQFYDPSYDHSFLNPKVQKASTLIKRYKESR